MYDVCEECRTVKEEFIEDGPGDLFCMVCNNHAKGQTAYKIKRDLGYDQKCDVVWVLADNADHAEEIALDHPSVEGVETIGLRVIA